MGYKVEMFGVKKIEKQQVKFHLYAALIGVALLPFLYLKFGFSPDFFFFGTLFFILAGISLTDWETLIIPNRYVALVALLGILAMILNHSLPWQERIIGAFTGSVPLLVPWIITKGKIGEGDIKLMAACGLNLGCWLALESLFFACVLSGLLVMVIRAIKTRTVKILCLGPFLSVGVVLSVFVGALPG